MPLPDESGSIVKVRFQQFLQEFRSPDDALDDISTQQRYLTVEASDFFSLLFPLTCRFLCRFTIQSRLLSDYMLQISFMIQNNKSTLFVNFRHIIEVSNI